MKTEAPSWLQWGGSRAVSLLLAIPLSLVLLIHPLLMFDTQWSYRHNLLMLIMWGVAAGYVHGVGFIPESRWLKWLTCPLLRWMLLIGGYLILFKVQLR